MSENAQQIEYWNGAIGERWARLQGSIDASLSEIGKAAIAFAAPKAGERVLDIGCGCAATTLMLADAVGAGGVVEGIDISAPMLAVARERAAAARRKIDFMQADAASHVLTPRFDLVFSRFGVMFFADPAAAFANIAEAPSRKGRLAFVCWRGVGENLWASVPFAAARDLVPEQPPSDPHAPGPFAFADDARLRGILSAAGFANIRIKKLDVPMLMGADADQAATHALNVGPLARAATGLDDETRAKIHARAKTALAQFAGPQGVAVPAACWLVGATL
ncbi:MAG TPA: class I SAM-dependent methyltransferase [Rhizomicrobium sp.]|jgi:SAM-dependent methyltransferase|nr:class I SAM-dependent methyltransferase [Rhizomicrobium sp.]